MPDVISSEKNMERFYRDLKTLNIDSNCSSVLEYKAQKIVQPYDMERYLDWIISNREINGIDLSTTFGLIDKKIVITDANLGQISHKITETQTQGSRMH